MGQIETRVVEKREGYINLRNLDREDQKTVLSSVPDYLILTELAKRLLGAKRKLQRMTEVLSDE